MRTCPLRPTPVRRGQIAGSITLSGILRRIVGQRLDEFLEHRELLVVVRLGGDRRAVQDRLAHEDARGATDRQRDGVRGTAIHLDLAVGDLNEDAAVENAAAGFVGDEILHHDPGDLGAELGEHVDDEIVGEGTLAGDAGDPRRDAVGLIGADPDRQKAAYAFGLQKYDVLIREHVYAHRLDRTRHEHRHKPTRSNRRASLVPSVRALAETESTLLAPPPYKEQ